MIVIFHVVSALLSVGFTTYLYFSPSQQKFKIAYLLIGSTLVSGTYLVLSTHSALLGACVSGVFYLAIVTVGLVAAMRKFAEHG